MNDIGGGSGIPDSDFHSLVPDLRKLANLINDAKVFGFGRLNNGGGGSPFQGIENVLRDICTRLDDLSCQVDVAAKALNSFVDTMKSLPLRESPIVLMEKETGERTTSPSRASEEYGNSGASDMAHPVDMNLDRKLGNEIE